MLANPAGQSPAPHTLNLQGNGEAQTQRALMRAASDYARRHDLELSPAKIRLVVSGYQSSAERDSVSITRWLEMRGPKPTEATALERVRVQERRRTTPKRPHVGEVVT